MKMGGQVFTSLCKKSIYCQEKSVYEREKWYLTYQSIEMIKMEQNRKKPKFYICNSLLICPLISLCSVIFTVSKTHKIKSLNVIKAH